MQIKPHHVIVISLLSLISACNSNESNDPMQLCIKSNIQLYLDEKIKLSNCREDNKRATDNVFNGLKANRIREENKQNVDKNELRALDAWEKIVTREKQIIDEICPNPTVSNFESKEYFRKEIEEFKTICLKKFAR